MLNAFIKAAKKHGEVKRDPKNANRVHVRKDGARLTVEYSRFFYAYERWERTKNGGMRKCSWGTTSDIKDITGTQLKFFADMKAEEIDDNPEPLQFLEVDTGNKFVARQYIDGIIISRVRATIHGVEVAGIVSREGRTINKDVYDPKRSELWFHLECVNHLDATFDIISDGEVFHPINRYSKRKNGQMSITADLRPKISVNLGKMNSYDKEIIRYAINEYMSRVFGEEDNGKVS